MLTGKQKRALRAQAHHLQPHMQIGKAGVTGSVIQQVDVELDAHELIKISVLETSPVDRDDAATMLVEETGAEWVQSLGRTIVFYRKSEDNPRIELPQ